MQLDKVHVQQQMSSTVRNKLINFLKSFKKKNFCIGYVCVLDPLEWQTLHKWNNIKWLVHGFQEQWIIKSTKKNQSWFFFFNFDQ